MVKKVKNSVMVGLLCGLRSHTAALRWGGDLQKGEEVTLFK
jgi:hypothetical protein